MTTSHIIASCANNRLSGTICWVLMAMFLGVGAVCCSDNSAENPPVEGEIVNSLDMRVVYVPGGTFQMGSPEEKPSKWRPAAEPVHSVRLSPFFIGADEVTVGQFGLFVRETGYRTSAEYEADHAGKSYAPTWLKGPFPKGPKDPVRCISWDDAVAFCKWASKKEGKRYRLPTEAEWEFVCRESSRRDIDKTSHRPDSESACCGTAAQPVTKSSSVGDWRDGIHGMCSSLMEWCNDWYGPYPEGPIMDPQGYPDGSYVVYREDNLSGYRVCRITQAVSMSYNACCTERWWLRPNQSGDTTGFRVVMEIMPP
ncbi:MAG: SUMF1/EgtB/PvdO family nonheme iron enzyme [Phycisphaeraceae bacterium]|nr:SUMF1/EgtB/PvdO family nonheme iron enzyme [Phycisphaeraceae bacterium]